MFHSVRFKLKKIDIHYVVYQINKSTFVCLLLPIPFSDINSVSIKYHRIIKNYDKNIPFGLFAQYSLPTLDLS